MPLQNLYRKAQLRGWVPDADAMNAPEGALLRADNLVLDELGALALRKGSAKLYTDLDGTGEGDVHTHNAFSLTGFDTDTEGDYRFTMVGDRLFRDGIDTGIDFDGEGDVAMGSDSYQAFIARGETKKKFDGSTLNNWGIAPPSTAPTLATTTATSTTIASFASSESPAFVINEGTSNGFVTGYDGTASGAIEVVPAVGTGRFSLTKTFASDTNLLDIAGSIGSDTDLFDMFFWLEEPTVVKSVTIMFGMGTGTDPFLQDYYSFTFDIQGGEVSQVKNSKTYSAASYDKYVSQIQSVLTPGDITKVSTPEQVRAVLDRLTGLVGPVSKIRNDAQAASPAWAHLSVTRGQFDRVGGSAGRDWSTIRGFKVVYQATPNSTKVVRLDSAMMYGGGDRALTGRFQAGYRFVRNTGAYQELSPLSPISDPIVLTSQALQITIPAVAISGADSQVNEIWIYIYGGFLDTFYRFAVTGSTANTSTMRIDEFASSPDGSFSNADRTRLVNQGLSIPGSTPNPDINVSIFKSEVDVLIENESLEPGCIVPPDNVVAIEGPLASRMFALTEDGWLYISGQRRPSTFSAYWALDLRQWGTPLWMQATVGGIYIGMSDDIILIQGTGDESPDHIKIDFVPIPQHVANPPIDQCSYTDQSTIIYRSADGLMALTGSTLTPVSQGVTTLLWRGKVRHDVQPLNNETGRFRVAVDRHILYMLAPEGDDNIESTQIIWRFANQTWCRTIYPANFRSIFREPNGTLVAGDDEGNLWQLEVGEQDEGAAIPIEVRTPIDDGGEPLSRKDPFDFQIHTDTGGLPLDIAVHTEGSDSAAETYTANTSMPDVYMFNASDLEVFRRIQFRMTGSFNRFVLHALNLSYRKRPQMVMALDTGAVLPAEPRRWSWIRQVEVDVISPVDLTLVTYMNDVEVDSRTVTVVPNKRGNYRLSIPRGVAGDRPRFKLYTSNADAAGSPGFEPYAIRVRYGPTGNESNREFVSVWATGESLT